jgi:hypothetical protein
MNLPGAMRDDNPGPGAGPVAGLQSPADSFAGSRDLGLLAGRFRWVICALLFLGITKKYMDRQVLGLLKGPLQREFGWNEIDYGNLVFAFQAAYAVGLVGIGRAIDRLGARIGYAAAMVFWSLASMGHAIARSLSGFMFLPARRWASVKRASFRPVSKLSPNGSPKKRARWQQEFSMLAPTSAPSSLRWSCLG